LARTSDGDKKHDPARDKNAKWTLATGGARGYRRRNPKSHDSASNGRLLQ
jgi:hypothetical protein